DQLPLSASSRSKPFLLLYVSTVDVYKHQWHVADAVASLRREGLPVALQLLGAPLPLGLRRLCRVLARIDPHKTFIHYDGMIAHEALESCYHAADAFIFASSCENMPNILLEAMASGLPIACSKRGPMPEILGNAGVYFDPDKPN